MMRRVFSLVLIIFVTVGFYFGVSRLHDTSFVHAARQDDRFGELENFSQALKIIKDSYVDEVSDSHLIQGAIKGMLYELDPHSSYFTAEQYKSFMTDMKGEFGGLGMNIGMRSNSITVIAPIEDTPAHKAGIKSGDIIYKIDNALTQGMNTDEAVKLMRGKPGTKVTLTIIRKSEQEPLVFNLTRAIIKVKTVKSELLDKNIGYVRLTNFQENSGAEVKQALANLDKQGIKGIIFDLRANPGGSLAEAVNVASLFLQQGKAVVITKGRDEKGTPLNTRNVGYSNTKLPLVVLVDEGSASASEIVAGAVQDYARGVVVGVTTFGKASVQTLIELRGGAAMKLTTARYYTPNGRSIQGVGIVPDVEVQRGTISYAERGFTIKERDLTGHLQGENEGGELGEDGKVVGDEDLQLKSAIQIVRAMGLLLEKKEETPAAK